MKDLDWQQAPIAGKAYADYLPDDCTCRAVNYSDSGGWYFTPRPDCPVHGNDNA